MWKPIPLTSSTKAVGTDAEVRRSLWIFRVRGTGQLSWYSTLSPLAVEAATGLPGLG